MVTVRHFEMGKLIPRNIYRTFPRKDSLPIEIEKEIEALKERNPDWNHVVYDDQDIISFITTEYGEEMHGIYQSINPEYGAARADLFRYLLIYAKGGAYIDIKSSIARPLDDILMPSDSFVVSKWGRKYADMGLHEELKNVPNGEFQQWHIISVAGHPLLKAVIEKVISNLIAYRILRDGVGRKGVLRVTGPIAYTLAIEGSRGMHPLREIDSEKEGFEYSIFDRNTQSSHKTLFAKHYSGLSTPIVRRNWLSDMNSLTMYKTKQAFARLLNGIRRRLAS